MFDICATPEQLRFDALLMLWGCFRGETARSLKLCDLFLIEYPDIGPLLPRPPTLRLWRPRWKSGRLLTIRHL
jgi:hypothetical protein